MLNHEVAPAVLLTGLWTPLVVALLTVAATVAVAMMSARVDDLRRAERLTRVLKGMTDSSERELVATVRDDYAVSWALRQAAPVSRGLRRLAAAMTVAGGVALTAATLVGLYVGLGFGTVSDWFFWVYYSVAVALLLGAGWVRRLAERRGRSWILAERARRGLREPLLDDLRRESAAPARMKTS